MKISGIYTIFALVLTVVSILEEDFSISGIDYIIYFLFVILIWIKHRGRVCFQSHYIRLLMSLLLLMIVNQLFSPYSTKFKYFLIGSIFTCLPFFHYLLSYNIHFGVKSIEKFMRSFMYVIMVIIIIPIIETYVFKSSLLEGTLLSSNIIRMGYYASLCNISLLFSMALYNIHKKRKYLYFAVFFFLVPVFIIQTKAIVGSLIIITGYFVLNSSKTLKIILSSVLFILLSLPMMLQIPLVNQKLTEQAAIYLSEDAIENTARTALYYTAFKIANDNFPLGSGQGTYGSLPVGMYESPVYADYGIDKIWGIDYSQEANFRFDTHWSFVIGECGYLGTILYLLLFFFPIRGLMKKTSISSFSPTFKYIIYVCLVIIFIESFALPIPNRFGFIFVYAGLIPIMRYNIFREENDEKLKINQINKV